MSGWSNLHKWVVRFNDNPEADLDVLENILRVENISQPTDNGNTVIHFATLGKCSRVLDYLIRIAPSNVIHQANQTEETPLFWACSAGSVAHVRLLLKAGADHTTQDQFGNTILHAAVQSGNYPVAKYILRKKLCELEEENLKGNTVLAVACEEQELAIARLLVREGAVTSTLLLQYVGRDEPAVVKVLASSGSFQLETFSLRNPLHYAVVFNNYQVARILTQANSHWKDETDRDGNKPAHLLQNSSDKKLARLLGSSINTNQATSQNLK